MTQAFIDMGTNTLKLQFASGKEDFQEGVAMTRVVRLGEGAQGMLHPLAMERAWKTLALFQDEIKRREAEPVRLYATSATREAANGKAFLKEIEERFGWSCVILTEEEEATYGFAGASFDHFKAITLIDIGGGSTEISTGVRVPTITKSYPVGALKQSASPRDLSKIFTKLPPRQGEVVGIGGTLRMLAAIQKEITSYSREKLHPTWMQRDWLENLIKRLIRMTPEALRTLCAMEPERSELLKGGAEILLHLLDAYEADGFTYSDYGTMEGFALMHWRDS